MVSSGPFYFWHGLFGAAHDVDEDSQVHARLVDVHESADVDDGGDGGEYDAGGDRGDCR